MKAFLEASAKAKDNLKSVEEYFSVLGMLKVVLESD
jgi:hypothetical protein